MGRAILDTLSPLPELDLTWVDTSLCRFPDHVPASVTTLPSVEPARLIAHAPIDAHHLILTYSHALDLELCHQLLNHSFQSAGLIGSATKWARFCKRLTELGHAPDQVARIQCPIGDPSLGKHPQAIAVGVAVAVLKTIKHQNLKQGRIA